MIPIVEDYLSELLEEKLAFISSNPNELDKILATSQPKLNSLKTYLQSTPVRVVKGYPRDATVLPAICILLSNEEETQGGLGDYAEDEDVDIRAHSEELIVVNKEGAPLSIPHVRTSLKPLFEVSEIIHNRTGIVLEPHEYGVHNEHLGLIGFYGDLVEDGDSLTVNYTYRATASIELSTMYEANFRLEVWTDNGDLTVHLYHLVKWAMLSGRDSLVTNNNLYRQRTSGADFEPAPNYFPSFVYRRALNFWCQFDASTGIESVPYITDVGVNQTIYFEGGDN